MDKRVNDFNHNELSLKRENDNLKRINNDLNNDFEINISKLKDKASAYLEEINRLNLFNKDLQSQVDELRKQRNEDYIIINTLKEENEINNNLKSNNHGLREEIANLQQKLLYTSKTDIDNKSDFSEMPIIKSNFNKEQEYLHTQNQIMNQLMEEKRIKQN